VGILADVLTVSVMLDVRRMVLSSWLMVIDELEAILLVVIVLVTLDVKRMVLPCWLVMTDELDARLLVLTGNDVAKPPPVDVV
jgi:hypothetical protein